MPESPEQILARSHRMLVGVAALQTLVCGALVAVVILDRPSPAPPPPPQVLAAAAPAECVCPDVPTQPAAEATASVDEPVAAPVEPSAPVAAPVPARPVAAPEPAARAPAPAPKPAAAPPGAAAPSGVATIAIPTTEPFTSIEVNCPRSGYRNRATFVEGVASVPDLPATEPCTVEFKGGPPARNVIRGGENKRCTFDKGQAICA